MTNYLRNQVFLLVGLLLYTQCGFCCKCIPKTDEQKFCSSNIALRVMVNDGGTIVDNNKIYRVTTHRVYKSTVPTKRVNLSQIVTRTSSAACGVDLTPERQYFLTGYIEDTLTESHLGRRQIHVSSCDWIQDFFTLSPSQRRFIKTTSKCPVKMPVSLF